jgi:hypothetical protein
MQGMGKLNEFFEVDSGILAGTPKEVKKSNFTSILILILISILAIALEILAR